MHFKLRQYLRLLWWYCHSFLYNAQMSNNKEDSGWLFFNWISPTKHFCASSRVKISLFISTLMVFANSLGRAIEALKLYRWKQNGARSTTSRCEYLYARPRARLSVMYTTHVFTSAHFAHACVCEFFFENVARRQQIEQSFPSTTTLHI